MYLILRTHSSNDAYNGNADYAVVALTGTLQRTLLHRVTTLHCLTQQKAMASLHHMTYWDDSARYAPSAMIDDADGDTEFVISTVDGAPASAKLASDGLVILETLHDPEEDGESMYANTDCHMMEVTADSVRWTCLLKHADVRLTTWDVPVRLFETLADMEETTNA